MESILGKNKMETSTSLFDGHHLTCNDFLSSKQHALPESAGLLVLLWNFHNRSELSHSSVATPAWSPPSLSNEKLEIRLEISACLPAARPTSHSLTLNRVLVS